MSAAPPPLPRGSGSRELRLRIASAAVLVPVAIAATIVGGAVFAAVAALVAAAVSVEWAGVTQADAAPPRVVAATVGAVAAVIAVALAAMGDARAGLAVLAVAAALVGLLVRRGPGGRGLAALGILYAGVPGVMLVVMRAAPGGLWLVVFAFIVVWATDIAAYAGGRTFGGPKLWPLVSPKKTWSGAATGLLGGVVAGLAVAAVPGAPPAGTALAAALLSVASQLGDLAESGLKRRFGKKDSGRLIPGHGGVMDRVDGLLAAIVVLGLLDVAGLAPFGPAAGSGP